MTALSLIQALIPTAPSAQSGTLSTAVPSGQSRLNGQGSANNPFALLVPGVSVDGGAADGEIASDTETATLLIGASENNPPTDLISVLAGSKITSKQGAESDVLAGDGLGLAPTLETELVVEHSERPADGTEVAIVPGTPPAQNTTDVSAGINNASTANGVVAQAPTPHSPTPIDPESALKAAAPQTQAGTSPAQQGAATPALQVQGDILEGGQGAPAAQKLLGIADAKAVTDSTQKDPAAATLVWGAQHKNGPQGANGKGQPQNPFLVTSQNSANVQPAFHEGQSQTDLPEAVALKAPPPSVAAAQSRFDVAAQQTVGLDASVTATDTPEGLVVGEQRPPVTVTVRFDQTIQGPQLAAQHLAMHIKRNFANGVNRFEVRLDPPELGRIDVRLDLNADGRVAAALTVDRPETLDLLQRDARLLQKALQEAGINLEDSNLNFSLRDGGGQSAEQGDQSRGTNADGGVIADAEDESVPDLPQHTAIIQDDRVDIRI